MPAKSRRYEEIKVVGEGVFGLVYKAHDWVTDRTVAIKQMKTEDGDYIGDLREVQLLKRLKHPNVISFLNRFGRGLNVSLVFEFMDSNLHEVIRNTEIVLSKGNIKSLMMMLLNGLKCVHSKGIIHRDLKPINLLVNAAGKLKIADFGSATFYRSPEHVHTNYVVTRWYRAPELLLGATKYNYSVDVWSVGCILGEMLMGKVLLQGRSPADQLEKIFQLRGTPNESTWPNYSELPNYMEFPQFVGIPLKHIFAAAAEDLIALAENLLTVNPSNRCTCSEALRMSYFSNKPAPTKCKKIRQLLKRK